MSSMPDLDAVADAVMAAHAVIKERGTHEMKVISQVLLFTVGKEIAKRSELATERQDLNRDEDG